MPSPPLPHLTLPSPQLFSKQLLFFVLGTRQQTAVPLPRAWPGVPGVEVGA